MLLSKSSHLLYSKPVSPKHILFYLINFSAFHAVIFHRSPHHNSTCILHFPILCICPLPHLPYTVLADSVVQDLTWIAPSFSAHQKIPYFYGIWRILNVTYHPCNSVYEYKLGNCCVILSYAMQDIKWFYNVLPCWNIFKIKFSINFMDRQIFFHFRYSILCHQPTLVCFSGAPKYM